jgi:acetate kinase
MVDALLVLNAGSSSLKFSVFLDHDPPRRLLRGQVEGLPTAPRFTAGDAGGTIAERSWPAGTRLDHDAAVEFVLAWGRSGVLDGHRVVAVGHRIVHGGTRFTLPVFIDSAVVAELESLVALAPLHQPHNVAAVKSVTRVAPHVAQVACFDTAFHRTQPAVAQAFALPHRYVDEGVRRYGFHGLSYEHVASALATHDPRAAAGRTVVAHLGNGASLCAMQHGRSVATTMGFTALDGLMMGTRCGAIDPGVLLYLLDRDQLSHRDLERLLYEDSGLRGVSGISSDMRVLLASAAASAAEAVDLFVYRVGRELGSMAAALRGLDALVFTGGIGENAPVVRGRVCADARWLGLEIDDAANARNARCISRAGSAVSAWVIPADEDLMIAVHTHRVLAARLAPVQRTHGNGNH